MTALIRGATTGLEWWRIGCHRRLGVMQRISKILASRGLCSRREAERLIAAGQVRVDGVVVTEQGTRAALDAEIEIDREGRAQLASAVAIVLNKPVGFVSVLPRRGQREARSLIRRSSLSGSANEAEILRVLKARGDLAVAGRLDLLSRGLLILTTDGVLARRLIGEKEVRKCYLVELDADPSPRQIERLNRPMQLDGVHLEPMVVRREGTRRLRFELREGRKHQVRRCCKRVGLEVRELLRDAIGPVKLGDLESGHWRLLTPAELDALRHRKRVAGSR